MHTYDGCKADIALCKEFIKPCIAYAGHDFSDGWAGVKSAVVESLGTPDYVFADTSWLKFA